jgi:AAA domain/Transcriptional regulator, AbiEi antitoxin
MISSSFRDAYGNVIEKPKEEAPAPLDLLRNLRDGVWLDQQTFDPLLFVVEGIVPEGCTILAGAPKTGKSWLMLSIGLSVATGGLALGALKVGAARPVLYLALEDSDRRLQDRCRQILGEGKPIPGNFQYLTEVDPGLCVPTIIEWLDRHGNAKPLVIVDTLGRVMPSSRNGETTYQRDYRSVGALQSTVTPYPGAALVIVHHTRKAGAEDYADKISGTQGILGAADTGIILTRSRTEQAGMLNVTGRDVEENDYALTLLDGRWLLAGGSLDQSKAELARRKATQNLGDRSSEIYDLVKANPGISPKTVAEKFGIDDEAASSYLSRLVKSNRIVRIGRGKYSIPTHQTLPTAGSNVLNFPGVGNGVGSVGSVGNEESAGQDDPTLPTNQTPKPQWPVCACGNEIYDHKRTVCARCMEDPA